MIELSVATFNLAGAKLLHHFDAPPTRAASTYVKTYRAVWQETLQHFAQLQGCEIAPDIVLLQECIGFRDLVTHRLLWDGPEAILASIFEGYTPFFFKSLSSYEHPHPRRWLKYSIPSDVEVLQGYGICVRDATRLQRLYVPPAEAGHAGPHVAPAGQVLSPTFLFEVSYLSTGSYLGDRDTEPRLAVRGRAAFPWTSPGEPQAIRYVNFVNVHLTTLAGEREGSIRTNNEARRRRLSQLGMILEDIISAYNEDKKYRIVSDALPDFWILGGDLNATENSAELDLLRQAGFVDGNPDKRLIDANPPPNHHDCAGTKWSLANRSLPIVVDYLLCGLKHTTFSPGQLRVNPALRPYRPRLAHSLYAGDHAVVFATFQIP